MGLEISESQIKSHPAGAVASPRYAMYKKVSSQQVFTIKGQDGCGIIKEETVVRDHMDREFHILEELEMDEYDRKMTYDNWGVENPYYRKEDIQGID